MFGSYDPETKPADDPRILPPDPEEERQVVDRRGDHGHGRDRQPRPAAELLLIAPTKKIADIAYKQAAGIIKPTRS
jgi:hypothetical protein